MWELLGPGWEQPGSTSGSGHCEVVERIGSVGFVPWDFVFGDGAEWEVGRGLRWGSDWGRARISGTYYAPGAGERRWVWRVGAGWIGFVFSGLENGGIFRGIVNGGQSPP